MIIIWKTDCLNNFLLISICQQIIQEKESLNKKLQKIRMISTQNQCSMANKAQMEKMI